MQLRGYPMTFRRFILPPSSEHIIPHVGKFLPITGSSQNTTVSVTVYNLLICEKS